MTLYDTLALFGLFILFIGVALLLYAQTLGLLARLHVFALHKTDSNTNANTNEMTPEPGTPNAKSN